MRILSITLTLTLLATTAYAQNCDRTCADDAKRDAQGCCIAKTCADGKTRSPATAGHCCWPGQAWSAERSACAGKPTGCPAGYGIAKSGCVKSKGAASKPRGGEDQGEKYEGLVREATRQFRKGNQADALASLDKAIEIDPKRTLAYRRGCRMLRRRAPDKALSYCRKWAEVETDPRKRSFAERAQRSLERTRRRAKP
jgi:hypothetical protein